MTTPHKLAPWSRAELPAPPAPRGLAWLSVVGPGVIVLGVSIGSGEFLLGPTAFVRYGLTLLWVTTVAVFLQTVFNTELMRYTVATGEPAFTGFMRTGPSPGAWAWFYSLLYFMQSGWPAWAANAAGAVFFLGARRLAGPDDAQAVYWIGVATFLATVSVLLVGRRIERTLEILNWIMIAAILGTFLTLALLFAAPRTWAAAAAGLIGFDLETARQAPTSSCSARSPPTPAREGSATSRSPTGRATRGTGWGKSPATSRPPSAVPACISRTQASSSRQRLRRWRGGAGGGASCVPTNGGSSSPAPSSAWRFRRFST
jgi:hypothetical protein